MKFFTAAVLMAVLLACEADAGSFNLSVSFDPGFTLGRGHHEKRHRGRENDVDNNNDVDEETNYSSTPDLDIQPFNIPDIFTQARTPRAPRSEEGVPAELNNSEEVVRHHGRIHHDRGHRY